MGWCGVIFGQRYWFVRFRRMMCVVSRSSQMVDLTMSLYAKFLNSVFFRHQSISNF